MIDLRAFQAALTQIAEEKGINQEKVLETIEMAIASAYKKDYGERGQIVRAKLDPDTGEIKLWQVKIVVDETMIKSEEELEAERLAREQEAESGESTRQMVYGETQRPQREPYEGEEAAGETPQKVRFNEEKHIMIEKARGIKKDAEPGDELVFPLEAKAEFGRIAAQTAKQVIIQRIREAERDAILEEFKSKEGQLISGIVQRFEGNYLFFDIGKTVGIMLPQDRVERERYRIGDRMRLLVMSVEMTNKGPQVYLSRSHPRIVSKMFELEVPEVASGAVEIKSIAREAGERSKVAVASKEEGVDPIGSCVGQRGTRVSSVIQELGGEKIDIIEWKEDPAEFVAAALSPAKVVDVKLAGDRAIVTVLEDQLSLAIGKAGQNVRLAAKLTGWRIDIRGKETGKIEESSEPEGEEDKEKPAVVEEAVLAEETQEKSEAESDEGAEASFGASPESTDGDLPAEHPMVSETGETSENEDNQNGEKTE